MIELNKTNLSLPLSNKTASYKMIMSELDKKDSITVAKLVEIFQNFKLPALRGEANEEVS